MANGDVFLDDNGGVILNDDGDVLLDDGGANTCYCLSCQPCPAPANFECIHCSSGAECYTPSRISVAFSGGVENFTCLAESFYPSGFHQDVSMKVTGSMAGMVFTLTQISECVWEYEIYDDGNVIPAPLTIETFHGDICAGAPYQETVHFRILAERTASGWQVICYASLYVAGTGGFIANIFVSDVVSSPTCCESVVLDNSQTAYSQLHVVEFNGIASETTGFCLYLAPPVPVAQSCDGQVTKNGTVTITPCPPDSAKLAGCWRSGVDTNA